MRFIGELVKQDSVINHLIEFGFEDIANVYTSDDVMYVHDMVAITISTVKVAQEINETDAQEPTTVSDRREVTDRINIVYSDFAAMGARVVAAKMADLVEKIYDEMSAEMALLKDQVATLERALSVSDKHVADIVLANS